MAYQYSVCNCGDPLPTKDGQVSTPNDSGIVQQDSAVVSNPGQSPKILSLTSNVTTMTPQTSLIINAMVTDPQGIDDLIGGRLEHPGGGTYQTFATAAAEGAYGLTLTWQDLNTVLPIDAPPAGVARVLRARFYDVVGNEATADLTINLSCGEGESACAGSCYDLQTDKKHCGSCTHRCKDLDPEADSASCELGACALEIWLSTQVLDRTCSSLCGDVGYQCETAEAKTGKIYGCPDPLSCGQAASSYSGIDCDIWQVFCQCTMVVPPQ